MNKYLEKWKEINAHIREKIKDENVRKMAKKEAKHAFLYLILSAIGSIVDCILFLFLTRIWIPIIPSNITSDIAWMITSFSLNLKKNFKNSDHVKMRFASYVTISLIWMAVSTWLVYLFIRWFGLPKLISKFIQLMIMAVPLYLANRTLTFRNFKKVK